MTSRPSSYLRHLPAVLSAPGPDGSPAALGDVLRVFEKILTGIDDGIPVPHRPPGAAQAHEHEGIETVVARLGDLADPWRVPAPHLRWLASWFGLDLPPVWDAYQQRRAIAGIVPVLLRRGRRDALRTHLDLATAGATRPRITVDDSVTLWHARLEQEGVAPVDGLVSGGPVLRADGSLAVPALHRPGSLAVTPEGDLLVGDAGLPGATPTLEPGLWRMTSTGEYAAGGPSRARRPLGGPEWRPGSLTALAVDADADPWEVHVLDPTRRVVHRLRAPALDAPSTTVKLGGPGGLGLGNPIAMTMDAAGSLLVLDGSARLAVVRDPRANAPTFRTVTLAGVERPLCLLATADGSLVVGDGRANTDDGPAELVRFRPTDGDRWEGEALLAGVTDNPMVSPVAIVEEAADRLLVLDLGLRPIADSTEPFLRTIAEPAAVHRVTLAGGGPRIRTATDASAMVAPSGMARAGETLYVCDSVGSEVVTAARRPWRRLPHEFGVVVHFSKQRRPTDEQQRAVLRDVAAIVEEHRPAGSVVTLVSAIGTGS